MPTNNSPIGTPHLNYAGPEFGPFECVRCKHYHKINDTEGGCDHPDAKEDVAVGKLERRDGKAIVKAKGCCTYFKR